MQKESFGAAVEAFVVLVTEEPHLAVSYWLPFQTRKDVSFLYWGAFCSSSLV